jgi:hypothetical protein
MKDRYTSLKKELPAISKVVKLFPDQLHAKVFDLLVAEYMGGDVPTLQNKAGATPTKVQPGKNEIPGIARLDDKGNFHLTVRDPKATAQADAVKRLTYVAIRSYLLLKKEESAVSRKKIVNPILTDWRVYDGNSRPWLANDKGILRDGDLYSLDRHATDEADQFLNEILDTKLTGSWRPGAAAKRKPRGKSKNE